MTVKGFYADGGRAKIRFLPQHPGKCRCRVSGIVQDEGTWDILPADPGDHGVLRPDGLKVRYEDGTPATFYGTTVYALAHQEEALIEETLASLKNSPFNKIRMCVFPKHYQYNHNEPDFYPFAFLPGKNLENVKREAGKLSQVTEPLWDVRKPDTRFWDHLENVIRRLSEMDILVDLILFHPYDRWGFCRLTREESLIYLDYAMRRLAAFPNLMWSLANEYDLVPGRTMEDWYAFEEFIAANDPWHHMLSSHNCFALYDYARPNITHVSIQTRDQSRVHTLMKYGKPVFIDECAYEGNLEETFGSLTGQEMTERFWKITVCGGFATHGETFVNYDAEDPDAEVVFWAKGGKLKGESPERIAYLRAFTDRLPGPIEPDMGTGFGAMLHMTREQLLQMAAALPEDHAAFMKSAADMGEEERQYHRTTESEYRGRVGDEVFVHYFGRDVHGQLTMNLPETGTYRIEAIDTWNMTTEQIVCGKSGTCKIRTPERPYLAIAAWRE